MFTVTTVALLTNQPLSEPAQASPPLVAASTYEMEEQRSCDQSCDSSEDDEYYTPPSSPVPPVTDDKTMIVSLILSNLMGFKS